MILTQLTINVKGVNVKQISVIAALKCILATTGREHLKGKFLISGMVECQKTVVTNIATYCINTKLTKKIVYKPYFTP